MRIQHASAFINHHMTKWTLKDLYELTDKMGFKSNSIAGEFYRRQYFVKASEIYRNLGNNSAFWNASEAALSNPNIAFTSASGIRQLWLRKETAQKKLCFEIVRKYEHLYLFLLLNTNPELLIQDRESVRLIILFFKERTIIDSILYCYLLYYERKNFINAPENIIYRLGKLAKVTVFMEVSKLSIFHSLDTMTGKRNKDCVRHFVAENMTHWIDKNECLLSSKDIDRFNEINVPRESIQEILEERNMHMDLTKFYIEEAQVGKAVCSSILALKEDMNNNIFHIVNVWEQAGEDERGQIPVESILHLLLRLFKNPQYAFESRVFGTNCLHTFGEKIVKDAIFRKLRQGFIEDSDVGKILRAFDGHKFAKYEYKQRQNKNIRK